MNMSRPIVAAEVRAAMARANVTQSALAEQLTISKNTFSDRLAGRRPFTTDDLLEISEALGVDPFSFFPSVPESVSA